MWTNFSPRPISDPFSSDTSKPFLSPLLFTLHRHICFFPFAGELVPPHHIYCQPWTGLPPTSLEPLGSQEPSPGFLCLRNKCRPAEAGDLPVPLHLKHQPFATESGLDAPPKCRVRCARVGGREETWLLFWIWGASSVMKCLPLFHRIHFSKVPLCTEPFVSTLFLLNKKGELYYCANESSR